ncbi:ATP-grasp domain-containing protein [Patescibacteria group bacterium]|nr:ATP-grasp domain-containing protein [Patescibacteria group bacterium]
MRQKKENVLAKKRILLINTGSLKKKFIAERLHELGLTIIALNKEKNWATPYVSEWIIADTSNHQESLLAVQNYVAEHPKDSFEGAITFWEDDVLLASKIIDKYNLVGIPYATARKGRNKFMFREFCKENNLPHPKHTLVKSEKDIKKIEQNFSFPLVIKPAYGSSSAYVIKVENSDELKDAFTYVKKALSTEVESALTDGSDIIVEEYIDGEEVDVDILIQNGRIKFTSISDNDKAEEPFFIETGFSIPSSLPDDDQEALMKMADETLEKMKIHNGCLHYEAKVTKNGPVPIELNLRLGGDEVYSFIKNAWHVDMIESACKIALGIYFPTIEKPEEPYAYLAGYDLLADHSGIISYLEIDPQIKKKKYISEINIYKKIGEPILAPPEGFEYLGWITVKGDNPRDAEDNLEEALELIEYDVARFHGASLIGRTERKNNLSLASIRKDVLYKAAKLEQIRFTKKETVKELKIGIISKPRKKDALKNSPDDTSFIVSILEDNGFTVSVFQLTNNLPKLYLEIQKANINIIINMASSENILNEKPYATLLLDLLEIPFTGPSTSSAAIIKDKFITQKLLQFHEIAVPDWEFVYSANDLFEIDLAYPLLLSKADAHKGLGQKKILIKQKKDLLKKTITITEDFKSAACLEEYTEGKTYLVPIIGNSHEDLQAFPIVLSKKEKGTTVISIPKRIEPKLSSLITEIAFDAYSIVDCTDFGLVEVTLDRDKNPLVTGINPFPSLSKNGELAQIAKRAGIPFIDIIKKILITTIKEYQQKPTHYYFD